MSLRVWSCRVSTSLLPYSFEYEVRSIVYVSWTRLISCLDSTDIFEAQYTIERYTKFHPVKECWLPMAFAEPAFLHAVIFCADIVNSVSRRVQERKTAVFHLNQAIALLNEQLQCPSFKVTEHFIVVVCALASVEVCKLPCALCLLSLMNVENEWQSQ